MKREVKDTRVKSKFWGPDDYYNVIEMQVFNFEAEEEVTVTVEDRHNYTDARADIIRNSDLIAIYKDIFDGATPTEEQLKSIVDYVCEHFAPVSHAVSRLIRLMKIDGEL